MWVDTARWLIGIAESVWLSESVRARTTVCVCVCVTGVVSVCIGGCLCTQKCVRECLLRVVLAHRGLRSRTCVCMYVCVFVYEGRVCSFYNPALFYALVNFLKKRA